MPATPFSYRQYAGNGSTTSFSVPFPYLLKSHVKVYLGFNILDGTFSSELADGTGFTWSSGTQIACTAAPASGQTLTVIRQTPSDSRLVDWQDGSNLIADDLDTADLQNLYVVQEQQDRTDASAAAAVAAKTAGEAATAASAAATTTANAASASASTALAQSGTALTDSAAAVAASSAALTTANTASTNAASAAADASTASTNAANALSTANTAAANAATALTQSNTAIADSATAASTSATAASNAATALAQSSTALTNSASAVTAASTASSTASNALSTANTAIGTANAAASAVASAILYGIYADVAAIPATPANNDAVEVIDSTGIESFTPLSGAPAGFVGSPGLSVRMVYTTSGSTWNWVQYFPNDPESRYLKLSGGTLTGQLKADDSTSTASPVYSFDGDTNTGIAHTGADELALVTGGSPRVTVDGAGNVNIPTLSSSIVDADFVNIVSDAVFYDADESNYIGLKAPAVVAANVIFTLPSSDGSTGQLLSTNGSGGLSWASQVDISGKLDTATAASTYQAISGMSSYLTTASAASTYQTISGMTSYIPSSQIGVAVQGYDADTAKLDVAQTWTAYQTFASTQAYPKIPANSQSSAYTLVAADAGKHIDITTGGVTVPSGVFGVGDAVTIYNDSTGNQTITQGPSVTLRQAGTVNTGNRTLAQYGVATLLCVGADTFVITGAGLS